MSSFRRAPLGFALGALLGGCGGGEASTSVLVQLWTVSGSDAPRPTSVLLSWMDDDGVLFRDREVHPAAAGGAWLGSVLVEIDDDRGGRRRAFARGRVGTSDVSEGWAALDVVPRQKQQPLWIALGPLPADPASSDWDGDGIPDAVDNCPAVANPTQSPAACAPASDGGSDGAAADGPSLQDGGAAARLDAAVGSGLGLIGWYYEGTDFDTFQFARIDPSINFVWTETGPGQDMAADTFSVRWTGQLEALYTETYTFYVVADDGARLAVNETALFDDWTQSPATERSGAVALQAGARVNVQLEYFQASGAAVVSLEWESATQEREAVPSSQLYPLAGMP